MKPEVFYPLYDEFDKGFFNDLCRAIKEKYRFVGDSNDKILFMKSLLCLQMLKDYRAPLGPIKKHLQKETDLKSINEEIKSADSGLIIDYSWAVWSRDKEMGRLAEKLFGSELKLVGSDDDFDEFVLRYLISVWLIDWEGPLFVLLQSVKEGIANLRDLNAALALWDFTGIFRQDETRVKLEDFHKLDLRVAKIIKAEPILGSEKLLRMDLDLGELGVRQIVSGIAKSYTPEILIGREIIIIANLEPRQLMGLESQGMLLATDRGDGVALLAPDQEVLPGSKIH